jgi:hypothetical protein
VVVAIVIALVGGLGLWSKDPGKTPVDLGQVSICDRAETLLADIAATASDDLPNDLPRDLVPAELAAAFPGSEPLRPNVLFASADVVRENIPESAAWFQELDRQDFVTGWEQSLAFRDVHLSVKVEQLGSPRQAVAYSTWLALNVNCRYSNEVFTGSVAGSIGFQIRWRSGDIGEQLTFVRGALRYTVSVVGPDAPADHSLVDRLAAEVAQVDPS